MESTIGRKDIDEILSYLKPDGVLCTHTLVCEEVPNDPNWFYLSPMHCTLWTNRAMEYLYQQYGFVRCAYHVEARMWFFFRNLKYYDRMKEMQSDISGTLLFSELFIDYWKQKPYR